MNRYHVFSFLLLTQLARSSQGVHLQRFSRSEIENGGGLDRVSRNVNGACVNHSGNMVGIFLVRFMEMIDLYRATWWVG